MKVLKDERISWEVENVGKVAKESSRCFCWKGAMWEDNGEKNEDFLLLWR